MYLHTCLFFFFFFKQKTAYEMRISDWSSDVCSSDLNYKMVQYNLYGDEEVTDLDGEVLTEKTAARKWGIAFTPTILFLPEGADGSLDARQAAVASMPGAFQKGTFLDLFTWVRDTPYDTDEAFQAKPPHRIPQRQ